MNTNGRGLLYIHTAVFLFGFSALFARLVNQGALVITFGRVFFSSVFLLALTGLRKQNIKLNSARDYVLIIAAGVTLAVHWYCFTRSIKAAGVAIGTITFSAFPVFVSFLEPVIFKERIKLRALVCSLIMLLGVLIITPVLGGGETADKAAGIIAGLVSSLSYAVLLMQNRFFSSRYTAAAVVLYEQAAAALVLFPFVFMAGPEFPPKDLLLLALLGIVFTALAHGLFVKGLRYVKAGAAGVISGLEAVYSIVLAFFLLKEIPAVNEIAGGLVVICAAGYMTLFREKPGARQ